MLTDEATINEFIKLLWRGGKWGCIIKFRPETQTRWRSSAELSDIPYKGVNWFFGPNPTNERLGSKGKASIKDIAAVNCLFADYDFKQTPSEDVNKQLEKLIKPTVRVFSGHGIHAYWVLDEPYLLMDDIERTRFNYFQNLWVDEYTKSDGGCKSIAQVMRLPGTYNRKNNEKPIETSFLDVDLLRRYSLEELIAEIPKYEEKLAQKESCGKLTQWNGVGSNVKEEYKELPVRMVKRVVPYELLQMLDWARNAKKGESKEFEFIPEKEYASRSEVEESVITRMILYGQGREEIMTFFNRYLPGHFKQIPLEGRNEYLRVSYNNAIDFISKDETRKRIATAYSFTSNMKQKGEMGERKRSILKALLAVAYQHASPIVHVSDRDIRLHALIKTQASLRKPKKRVLAEEAISHTYDRREDKSTRYNLTAFIENAQKNTICQELPQANDIWCISGNNTYEDTQTAMLSTRGLYGPFFSQICLQISDREMSVREIAANTGKSTTSLYRYLRKMSEDGIVEKTGTKWRIINNDLSSLRERFKTSEKVERLETRVRLEREDQANRRWEYLKSIHDVNRNTEGERPFEEEVIENEPTEVVYPRELEIAYIPEIALDPSHDDGNLPLAV